MKAHYAWALVALIALAIGATAQERSTKSAAPQADGGKDLIDEWSDTPHIDQAEAFARIRGRIPVLKDAEIPKRIFVDEEELYERKLAMYDGEAFHSNLTKYAEDEEDEDEAPRAAPKKMAPAQEQSNTLLYVALGFLSICALGYALKR